MTSFPQNASKPLVTDVCTSLLANVITCMTVDPHRVAFKVVLQPASGPRTGEATELAVELVSVGIRC